MIWTPAYTSRWHNTKIKALRPLGKLLYDYLTSNPYVTISGIYPLNVDLASEATGIDPLEPYIDEVLTVHERVNRETPLARFTGGVVWVVGAWKQSINHSANYKASVGNELLRSPRFPFWSDFLSVYPELETFLCNKKCYKRADEVKLWITREKSSKTQNSKACNSNNDSLKSRGTPRDTPRDPPRGTPRDGVTPLPEKRGEEKELHSSSLLLSSLQSDSQTDPVDPPALKGAVDLPKMPDPTKEENDTRERLRRQIENLEEEPSETIDDLLRGEKKK